MIIVSTRKTSEVGCCEACTVPSKFVTLVELNSIQFRICDLCKDCLTRDLGAITGKNHEDIEAASTDMTEAALEVSTEIEKCNEFIDDANTIAEDVQSKIEELMSELEKCMSGINEAGASASYNTVCAGCVKDETKTLVNGRK